MKRRRFCWLGVVIPLAVLLTPPLLWVVVVLVAPTNWAKISRHFRTRAASGRSVRLENLSVCLGGGIELTNLEIGAPGAVSDPWLQAPRVQIDVSLLSTDGWQVRADLSRSRRRQSFGAPAGRRLARARRSGEHPGLGATMGTTAEPHRCGRRRLKARLRNLHVDLADQPSGTSLHFDGGDGEGSWEGERAFVASLVGKLNEGPF